MDIECLIAHCNELGHSLQPCCSRCKGQIGLPNNKHGCFPSLSSLAACFLYISLMYSWIPGLQIRYTRDAVETESRTVYIQLGMHLYNTCMLELLKGNIWASTHCLCLTVASVGYDRYAYLSKELALLSPRLALKRKWGVAKFLLMFVRILALNADYVEVAYGCLLLERETRHLHVVCCCALDV